MFYLQDMLLLFVSAAGVLFDSAQVKSFFCRIRSVFRMFVCFSVVSAIWNTKVLTISLGVERTAKARCDTTLFG